MIVILIFFGKIIVAQEPGLNNLSKNQDYTNRNKVFSLDGHPINFYLNHPQIDSYSKMFFKGDLSIANDPITNSILDSVLTKNPETRPFYFFVFNQIVDLSDGKMVDSVACKCLEYVEKYPCEYFNAYNQPDININVVKWTTYIGLTLKDRSKYADFKSSVDIRLKNCSDVQDLWKSFLTEVRMCLVR